MGKTNKEFYDVLQAAKNNTPFGPRWRVSDLVTLYNLPWNHRIDAIWNIKNLIQSNERYVGAWITYKNARRRAKISPDTVLSDILRHHITTFQDTYELTTNGVTHVMTDAQDAWLTNFGAWALLNPDNPIDGGLFGRIYFSDPDAHPIQSIQPQYLKLARIFLRERLARATREASGILNKNNINIRDFNTECHNLFYNQINIDTIKNMHQISVRQYDPIANYMGMISLNYKTSALRHAINTFRQTQNISSFTLSAKYFMTDARNKMLNTYKLYPESDISPTPVSKLISDRRNECFDFISHNLKTFDR